MWAHIYKYSKHTQLDFSQVQVLEHVHTIRQCFTHVTLSIANIQWEMFQIENKFPHSLINIDEHNHTHPIILSRYYKNLIVNFSNKFSFKLNGRQS